MTFACPSCREIAEVDSACGGCGFVLHKMDGIVRALTPERRQYFERFLCEYQKIRRAEGRGSESAEYYRKLPYHDGQWQMRAVTFQYFEEHILPGTPADILDLGAGNGWLSYRMAERGHRPVAVDIFTDELDGLAAARHFGIKFPLIESEFERLPLADAQFDLAVYNASLHYATDYRPVLAEALRCLRPRGRIVVLDSPMYRRREHGERMAEERHVFFEKTYGFRSDSVPCLEFLWEALLGDLARELHIEWRIYRPWYGRQWHLRPLKARLARKRPPSRFWILEARRAR
jgi:SAM-dependent methyltransferase